MKKLLYSLALSALMLAASGCAFIPTRAIEPITVRSTGLVKDGKCVNVFTLTNHSGSIAKITNYGAIVTELHVPDKNGNLEDVVLGFDDISDYWNQNPPYFGAVIGRYGNRIDKARFKLNNKEYQLANNDAANHLHGGNIGFDKQVWDAQGLKMPGKSGVLLTLVSPDGDEGYPGQLTVQVAYWLTDDNHLQIIYNATTTKATPINLTNHTYFNLEGQGEGDILAHSIMINAPRFTPVDAGLIPTGELRPVKGTPMDFTKITPIGARINDPYEQLTIAEDPGKGYDHNWVLDKSGKKENGMTLAAKVTAPMSGRIMEVWTQEPGIQFYVGNFLDGTLIGKDRNVYEYRNALCLETQHYPDSPNKPEFPTTILKPGETYHTATVYKFSTK